jgi:hypothetical protein
VHCPPAPKPDLAWSVDPLAPYLMPVRCCRRPKSMSSMSTLLAHDFATAPRDTGAVEIPKVAGDHPGGISRRAHPSTNHEAPATIADPRANTTVVLVAPELLGAIPDPEQVWTTVRSTRGTARVLVRVLFPADFELAASLSSAGLAVAARFRASRIRRDGERKHILAQSGAARKGRGLILVDCRPPLFPVISLHPQLSLPCKPDRLRRGQARPDIASIGHDRTSRMTPK